MNIHRKLGQKVALAGVGSITLILTAMGPVGAESDSSQVTDTRKLTDTQVILGMNPGLSAKELKSDIRAMARKEGVSYERVLADVAREARAAIAPDIRPASGGDDGKVNLPRPKHAGDIYNHPAGTAGFSHGHVGMYLSTNVLAEAPGKKKKSRTWKRTGKGSKKVPEERWLSYVGKSQKRRNAAVKQVLTYYLGKSYDYAFWRNAVNGSSKVAIQLVWA